MNEVRIVEGDEGKEEDGEKTMHADVSGGATVPRVCLGQMEGRAGGWDKERRKGYKPESAQRGLEARKGRGGETNARQQHVDHVLGYKLLSAEGAC